MTEMGKFQKEVWMDNYKKHDEATVYDTFKRVADTIGKTKEEQSKFYDLLKDFKFIPGGRILANAGASDSATTLLNCTAHNPADYKIPACGIDSLENIYDMLAIQSQILKSESGYGTNFSYIRPRGCYVKKIHGRTPGVLKFMELWDKSSEIITMGATARDGKIKEGEKTKIRKGAQMGVLNCFSESTMILTDRGWINIVELLTMINGGDSINAIVDDGTAHKIKNTIVKEPSDIYEIETESGDIIKVTGDHKFEVRNIHTNEIYLKAIKDIDLDVEELKMISE